MRAAAAELPRIGLADAAAILLVITVVIVNITRQSWHTVRGHHSH